MMMDHIPTCLKGTSETRRNELNGTLDRMAIAASSSRLLGNWFILFSFLEIFVGRSRKVYRRYRRRFIQLMRPSVCSSTTNSLTCAFTQFRSGRPKEKRAWRAHTITAARGLPNTASRPGTRIALQTDTPKRPAIAQCALGRSSICPANKFCISGIIYAE